MRVTMNETVATPTLTYQAGQTYDVPNADGSRMVAIGRAVQAADAAATDAQIAAVSAQAAAAQTRADQSMTVANTARTTATSATPRLDALEAWRTDATATTAAAGSAATTAQSAAASARSAGDAHAARADNPHAVTAAQVGAAAAGHTHDGAYAPMVSGKVPSANLPTYPTVPVQSVNGQTGAVVLTIPPAAITASVSVAVPLLVIGGATVADVTVAGASTSMVATATGPDGLAVDASIPSAGTVRLRVRALLAIAAGNRTFNVRVIQ